MGAVLGFPGVDPADAAVGARLKRWRNARGMGVEPVAEALGLTATQVRQAEAGRAHLNALQIGAATRLLRLPVWALVSDRSAY